MFCHRPETVAGVLQSPPVMRELSTGEEFEILLRQYQAALRLYIDAVASLERYTPQDSIEAYEIAERTRLAFEKARHSLSLHVTSRGEVQDAVALAR